MRVFTERGDSPLEAPATAVTSAAASAEESFDDVYSRYYPRMVRMARLAVDSTAVAEELVQDAFVQLLRQWSEVDKPLPYLRIAVINHCRSWGRRRALERRHSWPDSEVLDEPEAVLVRDGLRRLRPRQRAAIILRYYEDLPEAEIATILGCRPGTVKSLLSRGLSRLKEILDDH